MGKPKRCKQNSTQKNLKGVDLLKHEGTTDWGFGKGHPVTISPHPEKPRLDTKKNEEGEDLPQHVLMAYERFKVDRVTNRMAYDLIGPLCYLKTTDPIPRSPYCIINQRAVRDISYRVVIILSHISSKGRITKYKSDLDNALHQASTALTALKSIPDLEKYDRGKREGVKEKAIEGVKDLLKDIEKRLSHTKHPRKKNPILSETIKEIAGILWEPGRIGKVAKDGSKVNLRVKPTKYAIRLIIEEILTLLSETEKINEDWREEFRRCLPRSGNTILKLVQSATPKKTSRLN